MKKSCLLILAALIITGGVIFRVFQYPDLNIHVLELYEDAARVDEGPERVAHLNEKYYYINGGKITDAQSGKTIYDSGAESINVCASGNYIWTAEKSEDSTKVSAVDGEGKVINSYSLPVAFDEFVIEDNIIFCEVSDNDLDIGNIEKYLKVYELSDNNTFKPVDVDFSDEVMSFEMMFDIVDISSYSYKNIRCMKFSEDPGCGIVMSYNDGERLILSGCPPRIYTLNENEMIFSDYRDDDDSIVLYKYDFKKGSATSKESVIGMNIRGFNAYFSGFFDHSIFSGSSEVMLVAQDTASRSLGKEAPYNISDEMKRHMYDYLLIFDTDTLELKSGRKTKTFERIIYADAEKAITYYKGNYITYSISDWKRIGKTAADEIKEGGSYTFELCREYVFVFDDNSGECINRIAI